MKCMWVRLYPLYRVCQQTWGMGLSAAVLGSPHLKEDTEGKVSDAHQGNKKDVCFLKLWTFL